MMNQTVFGGEECRSALTTKYLKLEAESNWCVGSNDCQPWQDSEEGIERYEKLREAVKFRKRFLD